MLSQEENELLCRVGPGTVMGDLMRQYWVPALMPNELAVPDCPPLRVRLLGENLIAFRTTSGDVGLIQNSCPHRGASMFFGRNEEEGLRCVYHGWKFGVTGACVDMPSEPAESNFRSKVRTRAYPCVERNGIIWTYMGPRAVPPPLPELPPNLVEEHNTTIKEMRECNYMQALEGDIDTVHAGFLHGGHVIAERDTHPATIGYYAAKTRAARFVTRPNEIGFTFAAVRPAESTTEYWRTGHFLLPYFTMNGPGLMPLKNRAQLWVPVDDEHTMVWVVEPADHLEKHRNGTGIGGLKEGGTSPGPRPSNPLFQGRGGQWTILEPNSSDWLGRFRPAQNEHNDYLIERDLQRHLEMDPTKPPTGTYSGIPGGADIQDAAVQESMGGVYDRTMEHLGTTDAMIIQTRRRLIAAAKALREHGTVPPGVDEPTLYRLRSGGALLPKGVNGLEILRPVHCWQADSIEPEMLVPARTS